MFYTFLIGNPPQKQKTSKCQIWCYLILYVEFIKILQLSESMLLSAVDCDFEPQSSQTKDYKIGI